MAIILSALKVPELQGLDKEEAREVWRRSSRRALARRWQIWLALVMCGLVALLGDYVARTLVAPYMHSTDIVGCLGAVISVSIAGIFCQAIVTHYVRKHICEFLPGGSA